MKVIEEWKPIKDYEGLYEVSNLGNVRSLDRYVNAGIRNQEKVMKKGKILKPSKNQYGYLFVNLLKKCQRKPRPIHRLVAETFITNHLNKREVNHKDGNKINNNFDNLEWVTSSENSIHAIKMGLQKFKKGKEHHSYGLPSKRRKITIQYDLDGKFIKNWDCSMEASKELGINIGNLRECCNGKRKNAGGYIWKYVNELKKEGN